MSTSFCCDNHCPTTIANVILSKPVLSTIKIFPVWLVRGSNNFFIHIFKNQITLILLKITFTNHKHKLVLMLLKNCISVETILGSQLYQLGYILKNCLTTVAAPKVVGLNHSYFNKTVIVLL